MKVWLGFPLADPLIGLLITIAIFGIVWQSAKSVLTPMLDGVDPAMVEELRHSAEHIAGIKKVLDVKARWLGHKLHAHVAVLVDDNLSVAWADKLSDAFKLEMLAHVPALSVVNVSCQGSERPAEKITASAQAGGHHHAPEPFKVASSLASGLLEIIDTPQGERMRLSLERLVPGMQATVTIDLADGKFETLQLIPVLGKDSVFLSASTPNEPHEFSAKLRLKLADRDDVLAFEMAEPAGHGH